MSTLVALRHNGVAVLATDSFLYTPDGSTILSDHEPKVFEVAPGVFYGWSGFKALAGPQVLQAEVLGRSMATGNLARFADALDFASMSYMRILADAILADGIQEEHISGEVPFHAYALAGVSEGKPGFLARQFSLKDGQISRDEVTAFEPAPDGGPIVYVTFGGAISDLV